MAKHRGRDSVKIHGFTSEVYHPAAYIPTARYPPLYNNIPLFPLLYFVSQFETWIV